MRQGVSEEGGLMRVCFWLLWVWLDKKEPFVVFRCELIIHVTHCSAENKQPYTPSYFLEQGVEPKERLALSESPDLTQMWGHLQWYNVRTPCFLTPWCILFLTEIIYFYIVHPVWWLYATGYLRKPGKMWNMLSVPGLLQPVWCIFVDFINVNRDFMTLQNEIMLVEYDYSGFYCDFDRKGSNNALIQDPSFCYQLQFEI